MPEKLLTLKAAAAILRIHRDTVPVRQRSGISYVQPGSRKGRMFSREMAITEFPNKLEAPAI